MPRGVPKSPAGGLTRAGRPRQRAEGAGRPATVSASEKTVKITVRLPVSYKLWLEAQPGGVSEALRQLVAGAMERET